MLNCFFVLIIINIFGKNMVYLLVKSWAAILVVPIKKLFLKVYP